MWQIRRVQWGVTWSAYVTSAIKTEWKTYGSRYMPEANEAAQHDTYLKLGFLELIENLWRKLP